MAMIGIEFRSSRARIKGQFSEAVPPPGRSGRDFPLATTRRAFHGAGCQ
jgi:hypothetical protein